MTEYEKAYDWVRNRLHITNKKGMIIYRKKGSTGYHDGMRVGTSTEWLKIVKNAQNEGILKKVTVRSPGSRDEEAEYDGYYGLMNEFYLTAHLKNGSTISFHIVHMYDEYFDDNDRLVSWDKWFVPDKSNSKITQRLNRTKRRPSGNLAKGRIIKGLI